MGNTDTADNLREDVLRVLDRLHLVWCLDNQTYNNLSLEVGRLKPGEKVTAQPVLESISEALIRVNQAAIEAVPATRFLNRRINKAVGLLESQKDADNERDDILQLQDGLEEWGLLARSDAETERGTVEKSRSSGVSSSLFPQTQEAIRQLKIAIVRGSWGWAPIRADELSDDGDRYGTQTYLCDSYSVFLPVLTNDSRPKSDVHIFFSPAGIWGSRFREPIGDTFKEVSRKKRTLDVPANELLVHGLRGAFNSSRWILIGVPGGGDVQTITLKDIQTCLRRGGQSTEIDRIRLTAYSAGHVGLSRTINLPPKDFPREQVERIYILDAEYAVLTEAINKSGISHSKVFLYQVTVSSPKPDKRLSSSAARRKIDVNAVLGLGYARAIEDAMATKPEIAKLLTSQIRDQLPSGLGRRGAYTWQGINQFGRDNLSTIGKLLVRNAVAGSQSVKEFVDKNDCLWYMFVFDQSSDAHHFFVSEIAHELAE